MQLDHTLGCVNFRDVGEFVNLIAGQPLLPEKRLYRGGKLDYVKAATDIGSPGTIINFRSSADSDRFGADLIHLPTPNTLEAYTTVSPATRKWLIDFVNVFLDENIRFPVLIHCLSGKDRTGIAVAALLRILDIPEEIIVEEYRLSDGKLEEQTLQQALKGFGDLTTYFKGINMNSVVARILAK